MEKSTFNIPKMDCAAEENLIRLQLEEVPCSLPPFMTRVK